MPSGDALDRPGSSPDPRPGFTLIEVVVALGIFALGIVAVIALLSPLQRAATDNGATAQAAMLGPAIQNELIRIRDAEASDLRLDAMAASLLPRQDSVLQLVGSSDATRVVLAALADNAKTDAPPGIPAAERGYLIEVRRQPPPVDDKAPAGYLALSARVLWPYQLATTQPAQASVLILNFALTP